MKKFNFDKKYLYWGLTALSVIAIAILGNHLLSQWVVVGYYGGVIVKALRPIIIGLVIAYVLNPLMKLYEKYLFAKPFNLLFKKNERAARKCTRFFGILLSLATAIALVAWLLFLIIPELYVNIQNIVRNMPDYIENTIAKLTELSNQYPEIATPIVEYLTDIFEGVMDWAKGKMLPGTTEIITNLYSGIYTTFKVILDIILGIVVCIYVLASKEKYAAGARKVAYAAFKRETAEKVLKLVRYTDDRFGGFLGGKIVDSIIIGLLSFVVFSIFDMPYTTLISVVIGVTNVIPFFGPFIGAIPSALLILLVDPVKAVIFSILILAIQQLDGNIIGPKILGDRTGLDSFGVVFSILLAGGLFGIPGVILGVPVFATLFGILRSICDKRLQEKHLPVKRDAYKALLADESIAEDNKDNKE